MDDLIKKKQKYYHIGDISSILKSIIDDKYKMIILI